MNLKKIFKKTRVIILIITLVLFLIAIRPNPFAKGVVITNIAFNSSASQAGLQSSKANTLPLSKERILSINNIPIETPQEYYELVESFKINQTITLKTTKGLYRIKTKPLIKEIPLNYTLNETVQQTIRENITINGTTQTINKTVNETIQVPQVKKEVIGTVDLGIKVAKTPKSNLKFGLDISGGTRVLLEPSEEISPNDFQTLIDILKQRLNVYGLSDVVVKSASDLSGEKYILIEIAGVTEEEVRELLSQQGKFEAKIDNQTVFRGGQRDITYVCRTSDCSGIDPRRGCSQMENQWACQFFFSITLSPQAAQRQADATEKLDIVTEGGQSYLSQNLDLYLDDKPVDTLRIGAELKGRATTDISISGSGVGNLRQEAITNTLNEMKRLQTIIITGSLPVKLNIIKVDTISPLLGEQFLDNTVFIGLVAILGVVSFVFIRYKKIKVTLPMMFILFSELILILGFAALVSWNLDLAALAGIIIAIGTGVDHLIVITDETIAGEVSYSWQSKIKKAMFIIMGAYLTTLSGMIPLWFAGAGLLRGFAFTTIVGISFGVFVARPAYAAIIEELLKE